MIQFTICLLTLLFSLGSSAMEGDADFWQSSLAAKTAAGEGTQLYRVFGNEARASVSPHY